MQTSHSDIQPAFGWGAFKLWGDSASNHISVPPIPKKKSQKNKGKWEIQIWRIALFFPSHPQKKEE